MTDPTPDLRIGHTERDQAVETLREAAGEGRLTLEELDERIEAALQAKTRSQLTALLADLLPATELQVAVSPALTAAAVEEPGYSWEDPLILTARWDDVFRAGPWIIPPFLEVHPVAANVKLDLVDARVGAKVLDVHLVGGAGDLTLIVPEGWGADVSRVGKGLGSVKATVDQRPAHGQPMLVVRGHTSLGNVKVRHPNWWDTKRRERWLAKGGGIVAKN